MGGGNQNQNNNNNNNNNFESQSSSTNNNNSSHQHPLFNHQWFANPYQQQQQQTQQQPYNEEDANVQKRLLEHYNQEKQRQESQVLIDSQYESALERFPESFAHVNMLYVDGKLNNTALKMFVDSGAQSSIISYDVAKKCGIAHLIDQRFAGIAKGVSWKIIFFVRKGLIHSNFFQINRLVQQEFWEKFIWQIFLLEMVNLNFHCKLSTIQTWTFCSDWISCENTKAQLILRRMH